MKIIIKYLILVFLMCGLSYGKSNFIKDNKLINSFETLYFVHFNSILQNNFITLDDLKIKIRINSNVKKRHNNKKIKKRHKNYFITYHIVDTEIIHTM